MSAAIPTGGSDGKRLSITAKELRVGDLILSTTPDGFSQFARWQTGGPVTHAIFYAGHNQIIDVARGRLVSQRSLAECLRGTSLAIAMRRGGLDEAKRRELKLQALKFVGRPYDFVALNAAGFSARTTTHVGACVINPFICVAFEVNAMPAFRDRRFSCAELVARIFQRCGVPIIDRDPSYLNPSQLIRAKGLEYLGHLPV